ncbi:hypothetical protein B0H10DRAFT_813758 [Mycena sp. CBHHK59/15]|nr:hypothetical protein B0H10DRAFT_813758 [Mycena sp. CBHHK59/15]
MYPNRHCVSKSALGRRRKSVQHDGLVFQRCVVLKLRTKWRRTRGHRAHTGTMGKRWGARVRVRALLSPRPALLRTLAHRLLPRAYSLSMPPFRPPSSDSCAFPSPSSHCTSRRRSSPSAPSPRLSRRPARRLSLSRHVTLAVAASFIHTSCAPAPYPIVVRPYPARPPAGPPPPIPPDLRVVVPGIVGRGGQAAGRDISAKDARACPQAMPSAARAGHHRPQPAYGSSGSCTRSLGARPTRNPGCWGGGGLCLPRRASRPRCLFVLARARGTSPSPRRGTRGQGVLRLRCPPCRWRVRGMRRVRAGSTASAARCPHRAPGVLPFVPCSLPETPRHSNRASAALGHLM